MHPGIGCRGMPFEEVGMGGDPEELKLKALSLPSRISSPHKVDKPIGQWITTWSDVRPSRGKVKAERNPGQVVLLRGF